MGTVIMVLIILITIIVDVSLHPIFDIDYVLLGYIYSMPLELMNLVSFINIWVIVYKKTRTEKKLLSDHLIDEDD
jgi:hypothetical protein